MDPGGYHFNGPRVRSISLTNRYIQMALMVLSNREGFPGYFEDFDEIEQMAKFLELVDSKTTVCS